MTTRSILLDTDLGSDVDDALALAVLLGSREAHVIGCTTVYGDTLLRARLVKRLAYLAGHDFPVVPGARETLTGRPVWWAGHEGRLFTDLHTQPVDDDLEAAHFLASLADATPGEIDLVAIGPLTNIAAALRIDQDFARKLRHLWIMGGRFDTATPEHNFAADPEAAARVFASGAPITVTGLEITTTIRLGPSELEIITSAGTLGRALAAEIRQWLAFRDTDYDHPHDPVAALTMLAPELFAFSQAGSISIEPDGTSSFRAEPSVGQARVTTAASPEKVAAEIVKRIVAAAS